MGEVDFNEKDDDYNVKIVDAGEYKEPGGGIKKPSQEEIDEYKIHRIVVMAVFGIVVVVLLLIVVIMIATIDRCEAAPKVVELPWWKRGVVYNVYPRSLKDSNGDGTGDFIGIKEKLEYIKGLGVKILYLSSVFKIDTKFDYGYAVVDFNETNPQYGSVDDFKSLVDAAHEKGIKVIIEFIPNETSDQHKWFKESSSSDTNAKREWYVWQDSKGNVSGNSEWKNYTKTGKYYLRQGEGKADLNWNNGGVQKELQRVLGLWLDRGVDGFRVVSVAKLFDNVNPPPSNDLSKIHQILQKWHNFTTKKSPNSILLGASHNADMSYYGTEKDPELDVVVNFRLVPENDADMKSFYSAVNFKKIIDNYLGMVPKGKWPSWGLTSWVHKRVGSNVPPKLAKSLNALLLTLPGTPIVFYGDEIGMKDVNSQKYPNDTNKSPMQWNNKKNAGFSSGDNPWFGAVGNASDLNADDDQYGIKKAFQDAVKLRAAENLTLLNRDLSNFTTTILSGSVLAYTFKDKSSILVVINFDQSNAKTIDLTKLTVKVKNVELKLHTCSSDEKPEPKDKENIKVPPMSLFVYKVSQDIK